MRITIVCGPFLPIPPGPAGAVERIWADLAEEFAVRGHEVTVLTAGDPALRGADFPFGVGLLPRRRSSSRQPLNLWKDLLHSLRAVWSAPKADVFVTNGFWLPVIGSLRRCNGLVHVHVARAPKGQFRLYELFRPPRYAAVSTAIRSFIEEESPSAARRTRVFPNPIDTRTFVPGNPADRVRGRIVYTGRIHPEKGLELLLRAARLLHGKKAGRGLQVQLIGPWKEEAGGGGMAYRERLARLSGDVPLELREPVYDRAELAALLREADVYVYPSRALRGEASPVAPLEAMACGIPTIVSSLPQFRDYLRPEENGFVFEHEVPGAARNLAGILRRVMSLPEDARARLCGAAAATGAEFSVARIADLYLRDFEELLGRNSK